MKKQKSYTTRKIFIPEETWEAIGETDDEIIYDVYKQNDLYASSETKRIPKSFIEWHKHQILETIVDKFSNDIFSEK